MTTAPSLHVKEIRLYEREVTFRMPFRFGVVTLTHAPKPLPGSGSGLAMAEKAGAWRPRCWRQNGSTRTWT